MHKQSKLSPLTLSRAGAQQRPTKGQVEYNVVLTYLVYFAHGGSRGHAGTHVEQYEI